MKTFETEPKLEAEELFQPNILYSDITVKMGYIDTLYNLTSGIVLLSNTYAKYISIILPTIESIKESDENAKNVITTYTKNYVDEMEEKLENLKNEDSIYRYISNRYKFEVNDNENNLHYSQYVCLSKVNDAYRTLIEDLRNYFISHFASSNKEMINKLDFDIKRIFDEIISFEEDVIKVFINTDFDYKLMFVNQDTAISSKGLIKTIKDVSRTANNTLEMLDNTYKAMTDMMRGLMYTINIAKPMDLLIQQDPKQYMMKDEEFF